MKKSIFIFVIALLTYSSTAQVRIKTILPGKPIIVNEPFRIQFIVENSTGNQRFSAPDFNDLNLIRGPEIYTGSQTINGERMQITNYVYTLISNRTGRFKIDPPVVYNDDKSFSGNSFSIDVERKQTNARNSWEMGSAYTLGPGEDPYKKIKENLFVKLSVSKRSCYVGEPVVATFKLFSRLQSKSDIVKNPGFYGFSVHDMINLDDKVKETEQIGRKEFDVHTIRKVQLYPLQAGEYTIDEMKIDNKVEFSRSVVNKKTEQQITEGVLKDDDDENVSPGAEVFETSLVTGPVKIRVNTLPQKNLPANYNGAVGQFTIHTTLEKKNLDKNEEGFFLITVEGNGNFIQLAAPVVKWPKELEGFEPSIKDFLDKRLVPLSGARIFRYPFISSHAGKWKIPSIQFSFFNSITKTYQTIRSDSVFVNISNKEFERPVNEKVVTGKKKTSIEDVNRKVSLIAFTLVLLLIIGAFAYWSLSGRKKITEIVPATIKPAPSIDELFEPLMQENISERDFYSRMHSITWKHLADKYNLSGTDLNKTSLGNKLYQKGNDPSVVNELLGLLNHFETGMFTTIAMDENRTALVDKIKRILKQIKA